MFKKILIANRGEIACRIIKTCQRMGIHAVAIYSTVDKDSLHVKRADSAYCVGPARSQESYLNIPAIVEAAQKSGAEAVHPGYGFLSENPAFAEACLQAGLVFIGPSLFAMEVMASKQRAKQVLEKTAVPLIPGYHGDAQTDHDLLQAAKEIGFPVLLKASYGGGGKGMRQVFNEADFAEAVAGARREAMSSFANDNLLIEKYLPSPKHIEIQVIADNHGQVLHLFERDCSIQRRHQKIIEEAPAAGLSAALRQRLTEAALEVVKAIEYRGAGTVEFLVSGEAFYFIEMNTRLQVEHPVTEMITGVDLVAWQLKVAADEPLPLLQGQLTINGHAIECRICAEDPTQQFMPSIGRLTFWEEPMGEGVRIDSGVRQGDSIQPYYDPMIAKLIVWGETREEARRRLLQALSTYRIGGIKTNLPFLAAIVRNNAFIEGSFNTGFLATETIDLSKTDMQLALQLAISYDYLMLAENTLDPLSRAAFAWQMHLSAFWVWRYEIEGELIEATIFPKSKESFSIAQGSTFAVSKDGSRLWMEHEGEIHAINVVEEEPGLLNLYMQQGSVKVRRVHQQASTSNKLENKQLIAPMPGTVVALLKQQGDMVKEGERLMVLEAMKMEHAVLAPGDGRLKEVFYGVGAQVEEGAELLAFDPVSSQEENELS
ncbi:MAG: acetyl/propionyl/methylcrotonyl-CoA carboxylase subunit alpha [Legionella sp.]|nr:acetyl/propionyl/methylcrotonyl-CoA carboxylase subunit alpha [Legionella sp.]